ncbi:hypothetical protein ACFVT1_22740 [Streptomyces sp. NPDC057963]|uniref:hypothetical protein n=1 Tax=Streptomyces sp. NPDC057963 TaxID=3346290 RepID=UPI0036E828C8
MDHEGLFYLFCNAKTAFYDAKTTGDHPWTEQTGFAVSDDLVDWTRSPLNPVLPVGESGAFDDLFASDPCVLHDGRRWAMFYCVVRDGPEGPVRGIARATG